MEIRIEEKNTIKIIGLEISVLLPEERKQKQIPKLHDEFRIRQAEIKNRANQSISYGIFIDPPNYNPDQDHFTWIAGVEVTDFSYIPKGMSTFEIPENLYAVKSYRTTKGEADYDELYTWVYNSEYELADRYGFEIMDDRVNDVDSSEVVMDLHFPIEKRD